MRAVILMPPKNTKIFFPTFTFLIAFLFSCSGLSQSNYNMNLSYPVIISEDVLEFEIFIRSISNNFYLTSYQCSFLFNSKIANGGELNFTYIEGTSQLTNLPTFANGINSLDGVPKLTFASMADLDTITEVQRLVGRFRLQNTTAFLNIYPNITWNFSGIVSTLLTGEFFQNITIPENHTYNITLGFNSQRTIILDEYKLFQNYPNPFNPTTKIKFNLPKESNVSLLVYNLLGQEIETLVDDRIEAGTHSVDFVGEGLPSGMYFCKLKIENKFFETIKMILLR
ncbi:MAG TPA: hypothetical protein DCE80_00950 [Ignavibacteriales bacterium]|nr:MAG: hypothetical protein A2058_10415 [Ignavibacteria bacterium GWA2_36_19]OGU58062.1 MAG: hypothetical protein A2X60_15950 [Ignavibacteria bacterium GWF2_35_20]HAB50741.1 hypothetical protein [Ignavibacteriales bacterium]